MEEEIFSFKIVPRQERFYNENTAYGVYSFTTDNDIPNCYECYDPQMNKTKGCILAGNVQRLTIGIPYEVKAKLSFNKKYDSYQYEPITVTPDIPKSYEAQVDYLRTQVTITQAKNILAAYPNVVDDVINGREINYRKIKGIGEKSWNKIRDNLIKNYGVADIITMLRPYGVTVKMVQKLLSSYSSPQILKQELEKNPYILTKLKGLGFKRVDDLALKLVPKMRNSEERTIAFLRYYFQWLGENEGDTWIPVNQLDTSVREIIPECEEHYKRISEEEKATPRFLPFDRILMFSPGCSSLYCSRFTSVLSVEPSSHTNTSMSVRRGRFASALMTSSSWLYTGIRIDSFIALFLRAIFCGKVNFRSRSIDSCKSRCCRACACAPFSAPGAASQYRNPAAVSGQTVRRHRIRS